MSELGKIDLQYKTKMKRLIDKNEIGNVIHV